MGYVKNALNHSYITALLNMNEEVISMQVLSAEVTQGERLLKVR